MSVLPSACPSVPFAEQPSSELDFSALESCIHCGLCLPACPTYAVSGNEAESPRGRLYLMKGMWQGDERCLPEAIAPHIDACLGCLGCQTACPSGVPYGQLLDATRQTLLQSVPPTFTGRLKRWARRAAYQWLLPNQGVLSVLTTALRCLERVKLMALAQGLLKPVPPLHRLLGMRPQLLAPPAFSFDGEGARKAIRWLRQAQSSGKILSPKGTLPTKESTVALFTGCLMHAWFERVHAATLQVLLAQGYSVWVPPAQTCCGALAHHAGEADIAHSLELRNLTAFASVPVAAVLVNAAGCGSTMQTWPWATAKSMDVLAFLAQKFPLCWQNSLQKTNGTPLQVAYHAACHLHHGQGVQTEPLAILEGLPGVERVALHHAEMCCGSAGVYNLAHPDWADAILAEKLATLPEMGVDVLVTANPGCVLQWQAGLRAKGIHLPVVHPLELLAQAVNPVAVDWHDADGMA